MSTYLYLEVTVYNFIFMTKGDSLHNLSEVVTKNQRWTYLVKCVNSVRPSGLQWQGKPVGVHTISKLQSTSIT